LEKSHGAKVANLDTSAEALCALNFER
jgi:hypothetical protein